MKFPLTRKERKYVNKDMRILFDSDKTTIDLPIVEYKLHQDIFDTMVEKNCLVLTNIFNRFCSLKQYDYLTFRDWVNNEDKKARKIPTVDLKKRLLDIAITIATSAITAVITAIITVKISKGI